MMERKDTPKALCFVFSILEAEMQLDDSDVHLTLDVMEKMVKEIKSIENNKEKEINDIKESDKKNRSLSNYRYIKRRYEPLYNKIISALEKKEE